MPELPDLRVYLECIEARALGQTLKAIRLGNPFVLRTVSPRPAEFAGRKLAGTSRIGKRLVLRFEGGLCAVVHLMILGRLHWKKRGVGAKGASLCAFDFETGSLVLTESGTQRRASLHLFASEAELATIDRGGLEPLAIDRKAFAERLRRDNHTLKRALTDPTIFAAIGNAYSDEILHRAKLSPFVKTQSMDDATCAQVFEATREVLKEWTARLRSAALEAGGWPPKVTAFHPEMAVHGRFGLPCPECGSPVQRIVYSGNEANYCARCQTGGRLLADRALSRLLHDSWPRSIDEV